VNRSSDTARTGNRVGLFCVGIGITAFFGFLAWFSFALATMMMDPALRGRDYWAAVGDRLGSDLTLTTMMVVSGLLAGTGLVIMVRAVMRRSPVSEG
jgi:hypothetical protein